MPAYRLPDRKDPNFYSIEALAIILYGGNKPNLEDVLLSCLKQDLAGKYRAIGLEWHERIMFAAILLHPEVILDQRE